MVTTYTYDKLNRLEREDNQSLNQSYFFTYDNNGNITEKRADAFHINGNVTGTVSKKTYSYVNDKLTSFNGADCEYDAMGNPTTYRDNELEWNYGRRLTKFGENNTFSYNALGTRVKKNSISFTYDSKGRLRKQSNGLEFFYDNYGLIGFRYNSNNYVYRKDIQGNITAILDSTGAAVVQYTYDAWGNHTVTGSNTTLGNLNPFRYRGYYYDTETKLYYLQTRYYDPETGRFINMDSLDYADPNTINGLNLYAYCNNNPVMNVDPSGTFWHILGAAIIGAIAGIAGQLISDLITGELSSWQSYVGVAVGGAVSGALIATGTGAIGASVMGSLAADATTLGLNLITGEETRTVGEILVDITENAVLSGIFAFGGEFISSAFTRNVGPKLLAPLAKQSSKYTIGVFFRELAIGLKDSLEETIFDVLYYKIKQLLGW